MSGYQDRLGDYTEVKDRIRMFYEQYPDGRLVTADVRFPVPTDDVPRISVCAYAYRTPEDTRPGVGWSWMVLPGKTPYTAGSELENTETSAWGRAIGALGIGIGKSVATGDEIEAKGGSVRADVERSDDGSLIGTVEVGDRSTSDFQLRPTPDGHVLGFRLRGARGGILVRCNDALAEQFYAVKESVVGARVTCWGRITEESFTPKGKKPVTYQVLAAERIAVPDLGTFPKDAEAPALTEAESEAIWSELEAVAGA